jgi:COX assembly protein 1
MNVCMLRHATQQEHDDAREEWFNTIEDRKREREEKERKRVEDERFWKEWWAKDRRTEELKALETGRQVKPKDRKQ